MGGIHGKRVYLIFRIVLGIVFVWAGGIKVADPEAFAVIVDNYRLLPQPLVGSVAVVLPWLELLCGLSLLTGVLTMGSALIVDFLLFIFIIALIISFYRGVDVSCGCFSLSAKGSQNIYLLLVRDGILFAVGAWVLAYQIRSKRRRIFRSRLLS